MSPTSRATNRDLKISIQKGKKNHVAIIENFPGLDAVMTDEELIKMADQLIEASNLIRELNQKKSD